MGSAPTADHSRETGHLLCPAAAATCTLLQQGQKKPSDIGHHYSTLLRPSSIFSDKVLDYEKDYYSPALKWFLDFSSLGVRAVALEGRFYSVAF